MFSFEEHIYSKHGVQRLRLKHWCVVDNAADLMRG
jgi:hypothetical protein